MPVYPTLSVTVGHSGEGIRTNQRIGHNRVIPMPLTGKPAGNWHHKNSRWSLAPVESLPRLQLMAEGSDTTLTADIRSFAVGHGGAKAVIEYVGKRGAR